MIIIRMMGGLGNQMFIYAFYLSLLSAEKSVKIDMTWFEQTDLHNGYELDRIFEAKMTEASLEESKKFTSLGRGIFPRISRHTAKRSTQLSYNDEDALIYHPEVFTFDNKYLSGYWQSEKYFKNIEANIREKFQFDEKKRDDIAFIDLLNCIREDSNSVSIHVRRGDYLVKKNSIDWKGVLYKMKDFLTPSVNLGGVCTLMYYMNALKYFNNANTQPVYYIFSDDIQWCRENFSFVQSKCVFVDINKGKDSYWDMYLMSQCKHNIIANSSFSWWGAWLNQNSEKIVLAPDRWFTNGFLGDILPENWIRIPTM